MLKPFIALIMAMAVHGTLAAEQQTTATSGADRRPTKIWNRTGPLGETPTHVTDAFPLSDQENKGGWVKFKPMTDEFEGEDLERALEHWRRLGSPVAIGRRLPCLWPRLDEGGDPVLCGRRPGPVG